MLGIAAGVIGSLVGGMLLGVGMSLIISGQPTRLAAAAARRAGGRPHRLAAGDAAGAAALN